MMPDLIGISETWFNEFSTRSIDGYKNFSRDRNSGAGGGVIIYVKDSLLSYEVYD